MRYLTFFFCFWGSIAAADINGTIRVIDGDTFAVGDTRVRLFGIDAPENGQPCRDRAGRMMDCGDWVSDQVAALYDGQRTTCVEIEKDRYGRSVATCQVRGRDVGSQIVGDGLAWAFLRYSDAYALDEKTAAVAERGIWAFEIDNPATYRAVQAAAPDPTGDCIIKGNISNSGYIYHMPHNRDYGRTRINESKGERWFCTESEARAAGWRPARN
ncbi:Endonuclease YncB, thermonuclease family [Cognatiyoonia koreensis]|uniref:Endonuclease YncB, thermonuclease family n=1 Tax=Cognatiyoonia koreensis TaxID=364200 RepID=A0A1I0QCR4_9RHOB|nr:thermonuclease family protein [Cognatiyoonia koreensis]SEW24381.1 Endonuclease YncB, thermonuclease family [Cognatiyoonia koreensis]